MAYTTRELSSRTFSDFEKIPTKQGGCWRMYYQRVKPIRRGSSNPEWKKVKRRDKRALVEKGQSHAILVYENENPVGWCQYGLKEELPRIDAVRGYHKVGPPDGDEKLWRRITCFLVDRDYRGKGVAKLALASALESIKR